MTVEPYLYDTGAAQRDGDHQRPGDITRLVDEQGALPRVAIVSV